MRSLGGRGREFSFCGSSGRGIVGFVGDWIVHVLGFIDPIINISQTIPAKLDEKGREGSITYQLFPAMLIPPSAARL